MSRKEADLLIPLKKPDSRGIASIFQSMRRTLTTPHSWKISRLASLAF